MKDPGLCYRGGMRARGLSAWIFSAAALAACQTVPFDEEGAGTEASEEGMPNPEPRYDCDPGDLLACPSGEKCTAIEFNGVQNVYECVSDAGTLMPYQACLPAPVSGQDNCPIGHLCVAQDDDMTMGVCLPMCGQNGTCEGACTPAPVIDVPVCGELCSPLASECTSVLACMRDGDLFGCRYPGEFDVGVLGDPCDGVDLSGCSEGLGCIQGNLVNGCTTSHCCTPYCDLSASDPGCPSPASCEALGENLSQPGLEQLGICIVPA